VIVRENETVEGGSICLMARNMQGFLSLLKAALYLPWSNYGSDAY
jgi:hypothetical protein